MALWFFLPLLWLLQVKTSLGFWPVRSLLEAEVEFHNQDLPRELSQGENDQGYRLRHMLPLSFMKCPTYVQAAKVRWQVKPQRQGCAGQVHAACFCKCNHHVGSSLHIPSGWAAVPKSGSTATLALCQKHARLATAKIMDGRCADSDCLWLVFVGARSVAGKYASLAGHGRKEWEDLVAGRTLAVARISELLTPEDAKARFPRWRPDTGLLGSVSGQRLAWPPRFAQQPCPTTLLAPVALCKTYRVFGLRDHALPPVDPIVLDSMPGRKTALLAESGPLLSAARDAVKKAFA